MNREELKELGLTDVQIEAVMKSHGSVVNTTKEQLETVTTERDSLAEQITERDTQLEELKKVDAEGLQAKIDELQTANETTRTEYEEKLHSQAFDFKLQEALAGAKARNPKALKALLELESVKLDGDKLLGLDDQLESLKESDAYLFEAEQEQQQEGAQKPQFSNGQHQKSEQTVAEQWASAFEK